jgi:hypothetical protein
MLLIKLRHLELMTDKVHLETSKSNFFGQRERLFQILEPSCSFLEPGHPVPRDTLLQWHKVSVGRMIVALNAPTLNWLETTAARDATRGLAHSICGRN